MNSFKPKIIAGCAETLEVEGPRLFVDAIDERIVIAFNPVFKRRKKEIETKILEGDLRYGCCDDVIIRGNEILLVKEYVEDEPGTWYYAHIGDQCKYKISLTVDWIFGYKQKLRKFLKKNKADFVFSKVEDAKSKTT